MSSNNSNTLYDKGQKIFVTLSDNRNFEGLFHRQSEARKSILFRNVSFIPDGKNFEQLELKLDQILQIVNLEEKKVQESSSEESTPDANIKSNEISSPLFEKVKRCVENHVFIDQTDVKFCEAIKAIENTDIVAITGEGSNEGRFGHITILGVATHNSVFLFDIVNLGIRAFRASNCFIKKILESRNVLKVVHNCSFLSDCLKHTYEISLQNVFDTQACHFLVVKNSTGALPRSGHFSELVSKYLNLPGCICNDQINNMDSWRRRPLDDKLALEAAWRVALLRKLKAPLDDALYAPFDKLCHLYLTSVRDLDDELDARILMRQNEENGYPKDVVNKPPTNH